MTSHETRGTIAGHDVRVTVDGPEAQALDGERIGADVLTVRIERALADVKAEVGTDG